MSVGYQIRSFPRTIFVIVLALLTFHFVTGLIPTIAGALGILPAHLQRVHDGAAIRPLVTTPHNAQRMASALERLRRFPLPKRMKWLDPIAGETGALLKQFASDSNALPLLINQVDSEYNSGNAGFCAIEDAINCVTPSKRSPGAEAGEEIPLMVLDGKPTGFGDFTLIHEWGHFWWLHDFYPGGLWWIFELVQNPRLWIIDTLGLGSDWAVFALLLYAAHKWFRKPLPPTLLDSILK